MPVYYGTKAKLRLRKLLTSVNGTFRWKLNLEEDKCCGYYYDYRSNKWIGFDNHHNNLWIEEFPEELYAKFFCYNN